MKKLALLIGVVCSMSVQADYKIMLSSGNIQLPENSGAPSGETCLDILQNNPALGDGVYTINPTGNDEFEVYCDMTTDGGGWTVFQKRFNGSVRFDRNWLSYKDGFGEASGEYWLGNDNIHELTKNGSELKILLNESGVSGVANYSNFVVDSESSGYQITVSGYSGNAGDALTYHSGAMFSTYDRDNDKASYSCSVQYSNSAWWYQTCYMSNLNGIYPEEGDPNSPSNNVWSSGVSPFNAGVGVDETTMMIR